MGAPSFRITVRPTTTALQLNEIGLLGRDLDQLRNPVAQHRPAVVVERAGIIEGEVRRQRAEAGVEVIEPRVDQLERKDLHAEPLADPLVAAHVAAKPIAGEQRLAAEQGIAGPLEDGSPPAARRPRNPGSAPSSQNGRFALPDAVAEPRADEEILVDQAGSWP